MTVLDINNGKAVVGRLAYSPMLGMEVGGSSYYGNSNTNGSYLHPSQYYGDGLDASKGPV